MPEAPAFAAGAFIARGKNRRKYSITLTLPSHLQFPLVEPEAVCKGIWEM